MVKMVEFPDVGEILASAITSVAYFRNYFGTRVTSFLGNP